MDYVLSVIWGVLIALKIAGIGVVATWSWWLLLAPIWVIPVGAFVIGGAFLAISKYAR
jgi:hypothetical protein